MNIRISIYWESVNPSVAAPGMIDKLLLQAAFTVPYFSMLTSFSFLHLMIQLGTKGKWYVRVAHSGREEYDWHCSKSGTWWSKESRSTFCWFYHCFKVFYRQHNLLLLAPWVDLSYFLLFLDMLLIAVNFSRDIEIYHWEVNSIMRRWVFW